MIGLPITRVFHLALLSGSKLTKGLEERLEIKFECVIRLYAYLEYHKAFLTTTKYITLLLQFGYFDDLLYTGRYKSLKK